MKDFSVIRESGAKMGDRGRLITRYSMSTCCVKDAKTAKDWDLKRKKKGLREIVRCLNP